MKKFYTPETPPLNNKPIYAFLFSFVFTSAEDYQVT